MKNPGFFRRQFFPNEKELQDGGSKTVEVTEIFDPFFFSGKNGGELT